MATLYIIGDLSTVTGTVTPAATQSWDAQVWGAGAAGNDGTGDGGPGAGWSRETALAVTSGVALSFSIGPPGTSSAQAGGNTWFSGTGVLLANGGGSATTRVGDVTAGGGAGGIYDGGGTPGGGGAGGPGGAGQAGGVSPVNNGGGGGGGSGGGGVGGTAPVSGNGGNGGAGGGGAGGLGATSGALPTGAVGPLGTGGGGGGGFGDGSTTHGSGGNGSEDLDRGGGGAGGSGVGANDALAPGANGGTPGGGGADGLGSGYTTPPAWGRGGFGVIKLTYSGSDPGLSLVGGGTYRLFSDPVAAPVIVSRLRQIDVPRRGPVGLVARPLRDFSPQSGIVSISAASRLAARGRAAPFVGAPDAARARAAMQARDAITVVTPTAMAIVTGTLINTTILQDGQSPNSVSEADMRSLVDTLSSIPTSAASPSNGSRTAVLADFGTCVDFTGSTPQTYTIPTHAAVSFGIGATLYACQMGTGTVTFAGAGGVTLRAHVAATTAGQYCMIGVRQRANDEWVFMTNV